MKSYYNEWDKKTAEWLRILIAEGLIADGIVDDRSITEVTKNDIKGFSQHHFFAGIGGWSYALRSAGYPDKQPVWTASLPCQPFSAAGKGLGKADERHLLPHFLDLVRKCKPDVVFGEQVERAIAHGWLDDLQTNMEAEGYAVGHCVLGAHSIGAPHIRQRLYWVAYNCSQRYQEQQSVRRISREKDGDDSRKNFAGSSGVGITDSAGSQPRIETAKAARYWDSIEPASSSEWMGNTEHEQHEGRISGRRKELAQDRERASSEFTGSSEIEWIYCRDNKYRPIKPGIQPLVDGISRGMVYSSNPNATQAARTMRLKGYGNAIVPQVAVQFIKAFMGY